eukprot:5753337-Pleurochrysis_carterae.AAC.1
MEEARARHQALMQRLQHRLNVRGADAAAMDWFRAESAAFVRQPGTTAADVNASDAATAAAATAYRDFFVDLFGSEEGAPLLLELAALLPSPHLRSALAAATLRAHAQGQPDASATGLVRAQLSTRAQPQPQVVRAQSVHASAAASDHAEERNLPNQLRNGAKQASACTGVVSAVSGGGSGVVSGGGGGGGGIGGGGSYSCAVCCGRGRA